MVKVLQVDQWHSTADNITKMSLKDFQTPSEGIQKLEGGDSKAATAIFGDFGCLIKEVDEKAWPSKGDVWFKENEKTGLLELYRANYDTSD